MNRFALAVTAALLATSAHAADSAFSPDAVKAHVTFLADDLLEGRGTGTRGYDIAARYVAAQFALAGLQPAGDLVNGQRSWFQNVPLRRATLAEGGASLVLQGRAGLNRWTNGTEILIGPSTSEAGQSVTAQLVFVGYGLADKGLGLDDYRGLNVKGKIVVALRGFPKGMSSEIGAHLNANKARFAEARGAIGMITVDTLEGRRIRPWARQVQSADEPSFAWLRPDGTPSQVAPGVKISARVSPAAAEAMFAGAPRALADVLAEADRPNGRPKGFALKSRSTLERQSRWKDIRSRNVAAMLPGSDAAVRDEVVLLSAHLDHIAPEPQKKPDGIYNGALDNAAGIATMLEAARAFRGQPARRSVMFLAVTAEEEGLLGARYFANNPTVAADKLTAVVNLDMPLLLYPFADVVAFGGDRSTMGPIIADAAKAAGITLSPDPMPEQGIFTRSDHYAFVERGVPSVMVATGYANGGQKAWTDFFATNYHQPSDDLSQPIDWNAAAKFAEINYRISRGLADAPIRAKWLPKDFFGERVGQPASR